MLSLFACATGCPTTPPDKNGKNDKPVNVPTYEELAQRHNDRIKNIKRMWARSAVEVHWTDENNRKQFQQGEGILILDLPDKSLLTIGKLGDNKIWAGSNGRNYWLFDLLNKPTLYLGRADPDQDGGAGGAGTPLPVRPTDLPQLLGVIPLPPIPADTEAPKVKHIDGRFVVDPPDQRARYHFDADTRLPVKIELLDKQGKPIAVAELTKPERMDLVDKALRPNVATRIEVSTPGRNGSATLHLNAMTNDNKKINDKLFDLDFLTAMLEPERIINLNKPRPTDRSSDRRLPR